METPKVLEALISIAINQRARTARLEEVLAEHGARLAGAQDQGAQSAALAERLAKAEEAAAAQGAALRALAERLATLPPATIDIPPDVAAALEAAAKA